MKTSPWWQLLSIAVLSTLISWAALVTLQRSSGGFVPAPVIIPMVLIALNVAVLFAGRAVKRSVAGTARRPMPALTSFRIAVMATAAAYAGPVLAGWYAAQALVVWPDLVGDRKARFWVAVVSALLALLLMVVGMIARAWCRRPPEDGEPDADRR